MNNNNKDDTVAPQEQPAETQPEHSSQEVTTATTILPSSQQEEQQAPPAVQLSPERQKPDLLGDIDDLVAENNERNSAEKGQMEVEGSSTGVKENG